MKTLFGSVVVALVALAGPAAAQTVVGDTVIFERGPTVEEIDRIFNAPVDGGKRTRGLGRAVILHDDQPQRAPQSTRTGQTRSTGDRPLGIPAPGGQALQANSVNLMINFELNSHRMLLADAEKMDGLVEWLRANPEARILVAGHADATGGRHYNLALSKRRAKSVHYYLTEIAEIDATRVEAAGYGEEYLIDGLKGSDALNRRVEFRLIVEGG